MALATLVRAGCIARDNLGREALMDVPCEFLTIDLDAIRAGVDEVTRGGLEVSFPMVAFEKLHQLWQFVDYSPDRVGATGPVPEWMLGMTDQFI